MWVVIVIIKIVGIRRKKKDNRNGKIVKKNLTKFEYYQ